MRELVENELAIYTDERGDRISITGPDVVLAAQRAVAFGMAMHELTTNALKHGALSPRGGKLAATWKQTASGVAFDWIETGVDLSSQPARIGFGTQLLGVFFRISSAPVSIWISIPTGSRPRSKFRSF